MKISQLINSKPLFDKLINQKMPIKLVYKVTKIIEFMDNELVFYYDSLAKVLSEFAQIDENGNYALTEDGTRVKIQEGKEKEAHEQINELERLEIGDSPVLISLEELEGLDFTPLEFSLLLPFISE